MIPFIINYSSQYKNTQTSKHAAPGGTNSPHENPEEYQKAGHPLNTQFI